MPADSKLCKSVFGRFKAKAIARNTRGIFELPDSINDFNGADGKCEKLIKVGKNLLLRWVALDK